MTLAKKLPKELLTIEKDCLELEKKGDLTEYGKGELHIIEIVKELHKIIIDDVWSVLNTFRMKYFFEETRVEIDVGKFDGLMNDVKKIFA